MGQGQGRVARTATRPFFSVTYRAGQGQGQGQGRAARANTRPLFLITLAFTDRPSDDRVQIIIVFTNCH